MPSDRETPNPFQSPRTLATRGDAPVVREAGAKVRDLNNQTVGFAVMTFTAIVAVVVGVGSFWLGELLSGQPGWGFLDFCLHATGLLLVFSAAPAIVVFAGWTLLSAAKWAMHARTGSTIKSEAVE